MDHRSDHLRQWGVHDSVARESPATNPRRVMLRRRRGRVRRSRVHARHGRVGQQAGGFLLGALAAVRLRVSDLTKRVREVLDAVVSSKGGSAVADASAPGQTLDRACGRSRSQPVSCANCRRDAARWAWVDSGHERRSNTRLAESPSSSKKASSVDLKPRRDRGNPG